MAKQGKEMERVFRKRMSSGWKEGLGASFNWVDLMRKQLLKKALKDEGITEENIQKRTFHEKEYSLPKTEGGTFLSCLTEQSGPCV